MAKDKVSMTAADISDKWNRNMKNSISDIQRGIDRVSESPMLKAVEKKDKMKQNLVASIDNGTWEKQMSSVNLSDWKNTTKTKVGERMGSGVDNAMNKRKSFDTALVNHLNSVLPKIKSMPDMTLQDGINRATEMIKAMAGMRYKKP